jgi:shikimate kinase
MNLIFLYGPPAVGKMTVAQALSKETGYRVFHKELTVDLVSSVFDPSSSQIAPLSNQIRLQIFAEAAKAQIPGVIFTYVYAKGLDDEFVHQVMTTVQTLGGKVLFVNLQCSKEELLSRVSGESRKNFSKIREADRLTELVEKFDLSSPIPNIDSLVINNTQLTPEEVAKQVVNYYQLVKENRK